MRRFFTKLYWAIDKIIFWMLFGVLFGVYHFLKWLTKNIEDDDPKPGVQNTKFVFEITMTAEVRLPHSIAENVRVQINNSIKDIVRDIGIVDPRLEDGICMHTRISSGFMNVLEEAGEAQDQDIEVEQKSV